jgi:hypothetical protein
VQLAAIREVQFGCRVEGAAVVGEGHLLLLVAAPLHVQQVVGRDPVEPGPEPAAALEGGELGDHLDQDLLARVLGVLRAIEHPHRHVEDEGLMTSQQGLECVGASALGLLDQGGLLAFVVALERWGLGRRYFCFHDDASPRVPLPAGGRLFQRLGHERRRSVTDQGAIAFGRTAVEARLHAPFSS